MDTCCGWRAAGPWPTTLLQLTFLKIHRARAAYVRGADPMPWFFAIAHRTFLDEARRVKRAVVRTSDEAELPEVAAELTGEAHGSRDEPRADLAQTQAALAALAELPAAQRQAVVLTKLDGRSVAEAAAIAGTTVGAMKVRAHPRLRGPAPGPGGQAMTGDELLGAAPAAAAATDRRRARARAGGAGAGRPAPPGPAAGLGRGPPRWRTRPASCSRCRPAATCPSCRGRGWSARRWPGWPASSCRWRWPCCRPRGQVLPRWRGAGTAALIVAVGFIAFGLLVHPSGPSSLSYGLARFHHGHVCLELGLATAVVPIVLGSIALRGALPIGARPTAAALGAAGGSLGGLVLHLHCPIADALHVGLIHGGVTVVAAALAAALAPRATAP
jgi:DNA-directed RNA polymerase specialized sigma24 family protein